MKLDYSPDNFNRVVYCKDSPSGLVWVESKKPAGSKDKKYYRLKLNKKYYICHRVVWSILKGEPSESLVIDHIDGNGYNNKIENLRLVTQKINCRNSNRKIKPSPVGITFTSILNGSKTEINKYIQVSWMLPNGREFKKKFNLKGFKSKELALEFCVLYRQMVIPDIDTYTSRHLIS